MLIPVKKIMVPVKRILISNQPILGRSILRAIILRTSKRCGRCSIGFGFFARGTGNIHTLSEQYEAIAQTAQTQGEMNMSVRMVSQNLGYGAE